MTPEEKKKREAADKYRARLAKNQQSAKEANSQRAGLIDKPALPNTREDLVSTQQAATQAPEKAKVMTGEEKRLARLQKIAQEERYQVKRGTGGSENMAQLLESLPGAQKAAGALGLQDLGRIAEGPSATEQATLAQAGEMAKGMNSATLAAQRSQALQAIQNSAQGASRQLRAMQAAQGMRGGAATAQQQNLLAQGVQQRMGMERDLLANQFNAQMQGLGMQSQIGQAMDMRQREAQQFNLTQASREKMMPLTMAQGPLMANAYMQAAGLNAQAAGQQAGGGLSFGGFQNMLTSPITTVTSGLSKLGDKLGF